MNIIVSDVSVVLLQNAYDMTSPFADASRRVTFPPRITASQTANKHKVCCSDGVQNNRGRPLLSSHLSIHRCSRFYSAIFPD